MEPPEILDRVDAPEWADSAELHAPVYEKDEVLDESERERFIIADNGQADWAMRKLAHVDEQSREVEDLAARQIEPIERWRRNERARLDRERLFWESLLVEYHRRTVAEDPRAKSIRLPHGRLTSRQRPATWHFEDAVFIAWANRAELDALVRVKFEVDKVNAKEALSVQADGSVTRAGGEIVPGVYVTDGERSFAVEPEVTER